MLLDRCRLRWESPPTSARKPTQAWNYSLAESVGTLSDGSGSLVTLILPRLCAFARGASEGFRQPLWGIFSRGEGHTFLLQKYVKIFWKRERLTFSFPKRKSNKKKLASMLLDRNGEPLLFALPKRHPQHTRKVQVQRVRRQNISASSGGLCPDL